MTLTQDPKLHRRSVNVTGIVKEDLLAGKSHLIGLAFHLKPVLALIAASRMSTAVRGSSAGSALAMPIIASARCGRR